MANNLPPLTLIGTLGELLVQIRLLQFNVQAAPPLKDSGNDLVAFHGTKVKTLQVKTSTVRISPDNRLPLNYDILALVVLVSNEESLQLDNSLIYLLPRNAVAETKRTKESLAPYELVLADSARSMSLLNRLFANDN